MKIKRISRLLLQIELRIIYFSIVHYIIIIVTLQTITVLDTITLLNAYLLINVIKSSLMKINDYNKCFMIAR